MRTYAVQLRPSLKINPPLIKDIALLGGLPYQLCCPRMCNDRPVIAQKVLPQKLAILRPISATRLLPLKLMGESRVCRSRGLGRRDPGATRAYWNSLRPTGAKVCEKCELWLEWA